MEKIKAERILVITEIFYPEEFLINEILQEWESEFKIDVLTRNPSYPYGKIFKGYKNKIFSKMNWGSISIYRYHIIMGYEKSKYIKILNILWNILLSTLICLLKWRSKQNIFVYHTGPLTTAFAAVLHKIIYNSKVTIWTQDLWPETVYSYGFGKSKFSKFLIIKFVNFIYSNVDEIIVSSPAFKNNISQYVNKPVHFVPNWANKHFDTTVFDKKPEIDKFRFVFAGNIGKAQNVKFVIDAFVGWKKLKPNQSILDIYGDGSEYQSLKNYIGCTGISDVILHGRRPGNEMPKIYHNANVLIISLSNDPIYNLYIPAKFSTYLKSGKPIFSIMNGIVPSLVKKYGLGCYSSPTNTEELIKGFDKLFKLKNQERNEINKHCKYLSKKLFERESCIAKLKKIVLDTAKLS